MTNSPNDERKIIRVAVDGMIELELAKDDRGDSSA